MELGIYGNVQVLSADLHRDLRVRQLDKLDYAEPVTDTLLTVDEFFQAARSQPIVFARGRTRSTSRRPSWLWASAATGSWMPA